MNTIRRFSDVPKMDGVEVRLPNGYKAVSAYSFSGSSAVNPSVCLERKEGDFFIRKRVYVFDSDGENPKMKDEEIYDVRDARAGQEHLNWRRGIWGKDESGRVIEAWRNVGVAVA